MLKAGIFLDMENINRCGGYAIRYRKVKELVKAQGAEVLRANAYMAIDTEREKKDSEYRRKKEEYRNRVRREGFHLVLKEVQRYYDEEGIEVRKANADLELAVDTLLQSENLDYVLLGSGDGDFIRLVRALQNRGKRVDLLSFMNTSTALRQVVDYHFSGFLVPGILSLEKETSHRMRGIMHAVNEEKGYGFLTVRTGLSLDDIREDIFLHINDFNKSDGKTIDNEDFAHLKTKEVIIEFELGKDNNGRAKAVNAVEFELEM